MPKPSSAPRAHRFRRPSLLRPTLFVLAAVLAVTAQAAPSGAPYGPIPQRYEVPQEGRVCFVAPDGAPAPAGSSPQRPTTVEPAIARVGTGDTSVLRGGTSRP